MQPTIHLTRVPGSRSFRPWRTFASDDWSTGPVPNGNALVRAPGPNPLELLLVGGGPATGYGVVTHELALAGHLARDLAHHLQRGIDLQVTVGRDMTLTSLRRQLRTTDISRYTSIIIAIGVQDALDGAPARGWSRECAALLGETLTRSNFEGEIFVLGVPPISRVVDLTEIAREPLDHRSRLLTEELRLSTRRPRTHFVPFEPPPSDSGSGRHRTSDTYKTWSRLVAPHISTVLAGEAPHAEASPVIHPGTASAVGIMDTPPDERFDRIVVAAHKRFRADAAALSFMDDERQWFKSVVGNDVKSLPRGTTPCEWTIHGLTPLAVPDTLADARFRNLPLVATGSIRAYAGHPILDSTGNPVGAICVTYSAPHQFSGDDLDTLRQLAGLIENLLART